MDGRKCNCGGTEFYLRDGKPFSSKCIECVKARSRKNYRDNIELRRRDAKQRYAENPKPKRQSSIDYKKKFPLKKKEYDLKRNYGISLEELEKRKIEQNNRCLLCEREVKLVPDHDHKTLLIRGLLCGLCNKGLGLFKDNPIVLRRAADYVENPF